jgi:hypothetical protein
MTEKSEMPFIIKFKFEALILLKDSIHLHYFHLSDIQKL